jgi:isoquinoline 1-oxidoreductase alpha subunit
MPGFCVEDQRRNLEVEGDTPPLWVLRAVLGMTGTEFCSGEALCGARTSG